MSKEQNKKSRLDRVRNDPAFKRLKELRRRTLRKAAAKEEAAEAIGKIQQQLTKLESLSEGETDGE